MFQPPCARLGYSAIFYGQSLVWTLGGPWCRGAGTGRHKARTGRPGRGTRRDAVST
jgi:hypothetical protein